MNEMDEMIHVKRECLVSYDHAESKLMTMEKKNDERGALATVTHIGSTTVGFSS